MTRSKGRPGFLAVPRDLFEAPLWEGDGALKFVFLELCFGANFAAGEVVFNGRRHALERGELVTSINRLAKKTCFSQNIIRRCIARLEEKGFLSWRRRDESTQWDAKNHTVKPTVETVYIINNYNEIFGAVESKPHSKPHSETPKRAQRAKTLPLYVSKNKKHTQSTDDVVCGPSTDGGGKTEGTETEQRCSILEHPLVIEWNRVAERSKLELVTQDTPKRQKALEAALRLRSDLSWWQGVFAQAAKPIMIGGRPWLPSFDQCLDIDRAVRYHEAKQKKVSHLKPVPRERGHVEIGSSGGSAPRHVPEEPTKPVDLSRQRHKLAELREFLAPKNMARDGVASKSGAGRRLIGEARPTDTGPGGISGAIGDRIADC